MLKFISLSSPNFVEAKKKKKSQLPKLAPKRKRNRRIETIVTSEKIVASETIVASGTTVASETIVTSNQSSMVKNEHVCGKNTYMKNKRNAKKRPIRPTMRPHVDGIVV